MTASPGNPAQIGSLEVDYTRSTNEDEDMTVHTGIARLFNGRRTSKLVFTLDDRQPDICRDSRHEEEIDLPQLLKEFFGTAVAMPSVGGMYLVHADGSVVENIDPAADRLSAGELRVIEGYLQSLGFRRSGSLLDSSHDSYTADDHRSTADTGPCTRVMLNPGLNGRLRFFKENGTVSLYAGKDRRPVAEGTVHDAVAAFPAALKQQLQTHPYPPAPIWRQADAFFHGVLAHLSRPVPPPQPEI